MVDLEMLEDVKDLLMIWMHTDHSKSTSTCRPYMKTKASVRKNLQDTLQNSSLLPARAINQVDSSKR